MAGRNERMPLVGGGGRGPALFSPARRAPAALHLSLAEEQEQALVLLERFMGSARIDAYSAMSTFASHDSGDINSLATDHYDSCRSYCDALNNRRERVERIYDALSSCVTENDIRRALDNLQQDLHNRGLHRPVRLYVMPAARPRYHNRFTRNPLLNMFNAVLNVYIRLAWPYRLAASFTQGRELCADIGVLQADRKRVERFASIRSGF